MPQGRRLENAEYDFHDNLELKVYGLTDEAHTEVYQKERLVTSITLKCNGNQVHGEVKGNTKIQIRFVGEHVLKIAGAEVRVEGKDSILSMPERHGVFKCMLGN